MYVYIFTHTYTTLGYNVCINIVISFNYMVETVYAYTVRCIGKIKAV